MNFYTIEKKVTELASSTEEVASALKLVASSFGIFMGISSGNVPLTAFSAITASSELANGFSKLLKNLKLTRIGKHLSKNKFETIEEAELIFYLLAHRAFFETLKTHLDQKNYRPTASKLPGSHLTPDVDFREVSISLEFGQSAIEEADTLYSRYRPHLTTLIRGTQKKGPNPELVASEIINNSKKQLQLYISQNEPLNLYLSALSSYHTQKNTEKIYQKILETQESHQTIEPETGKRVSELSGQSRIRSLEPNIKTDNNQGPTEISKNINPGPTFLDLPPDHDQTYDSKFQDLFDEAKQFLQSGLFEQAETSFNFLLKLTTPKHEELHARSLANLGLIKYCQGNESEAAILFDSAFKILPEHRRIRLNKGISLIISERFLQAEELLKELFTENSGEPDVIPALIHAIAKNSGHVKAIEFLQKNPVESSDYYISLATELLQVNQVLEAKKVVESGLKKFNEDPSLQEIYARTIAFPIIEKSKEDIVSRTTLTEQEFCDLEAASSLTENLVEHLSQGPSRKDISNILANLSSYHLVLENHESSRKFAKRCLHIDSNNNIALCNLFTLDIRNRDFSEALKTAKHLLNLSNSPTNIAREFHALFKLNQFRQIVETFESADQEVKENPGCLISYIFALYRLNKRDASLNYAKTFRDKFITNPKCLIELANFYETSNDLLAAMRILVRAKARGTPQTRHYINCELGRLAYLRSNWTLAIAYFEIASENHGSFPYESHYVHALFGAQQIQKCLLRAHQFKKNNGYDVRVWHTLSLAYWSLDDLNKSIQYLEELNERSNDTQFRFLLSQAYFSIGAVDHTRQILERIHSENPTDSQVTAHLSQVWRSYGFFAKAKEFAFKSYELTPDEPNSINAVSAILMIPDDKVTLTERERTILHEALSKNPGIEKIEFPLGEDGKTDFSPILDKVRDKSEKMSKILEVYKDKKAPIETLGEVTGDIWIAWMEMIHSRNGKVFCASGTVSEQDEELKVAEEATSITADISALLTASLLDILPILSRAYKKIFVPAHIHQLLAAKKLELQGDRPDSGFLGFAEGEFYYSDFIPSQGEWEQTLIDRIIDFFDLPNVELTGIPAKAWEDYFQNESNVLIGDGIYKTISISQAQKSVLFSDQLLVRTLLRNEHEARSFSIQSFLRSAVRKGLINENDYEIMIVRLVQSNYDYISNSPRTFEKLLEGESEPLSQAAVNCISQFISSSPETPNNSNILGKASSLIFLNGKIASERKQFWLEQLGQQFNSTNIFSGPEFLGSFLSGAWIGFIHTPGIFFTFLKSVLSASNLSESSRSVLIGVFRRLGFHIAEELRQSFFHSSTGLADRWFLETKFDSEISRILR